MADPSPYDIIQDNQISALQDIVTPHYQPPGDQEYSFPVVGQGVSSEMFKQISRAAGTGVFIQSNPDGAHPAYQLTNLGGGDSATNANNQMLLRVAPGTGRGEAAIEGFFHTLLEDMVVDFPAVSTTTTYYLCLTYDPRREEEPAGPIRVEVHANTLPTTHGRKHIVLYTVVRQPNQLLTDATVTQTGQWLGHVINVWSADMLPDPTLTEYGTLAVVVNPKPDFATNPSLYTNRGIYGWQPIGIYPREPLTVLTGSRWSGDGWCRKQYGSLVVTATITGRQGGSADRVPMFRLPPGYRLSRDFFTVVYHSSGIERFEIVDDPSTGRVVGQLRTSRSTPPTWTHVNVTIPDYFISEGF